MAGRERKMYAIFKGTSLQDSFVGVSCICKKRKDALYYCNSDNGEHVREVTLTIGKRVAK